MSLIIDILSLVLEKKQAQLAQAQRLATDTESQSQEASSALAALQNDIGILEQAINNGFQP